MDVPIHLSTGQTIIGSEIGRCRHLQNVAKKRAVTRGARPDWRWQEHIEGALAELALSAWTGLSWDGAIGDLGASDVGPYEVKWVSNASKKLLIHYDNLKPDKPYVLVCGLAPDYVLRGWLWGHEAKDPGFREDPNNQGRPTALVPTSYLRLMIELPTPTELGWQSPQQQAIGSISRAKSMT